MEDTDFPVEISVGNTCDPPIYDKETELKWYNWSVFIQTEPENFVNKIEFVTYHLHPSFRNVKNDVYVRGTDIGKHFVFRSRGWGEFVIKVDINLEGRKKLNIEHYLTLTRRSITPKIFKKEDVSRRYF